MLVQSSKLLRNTPTSVKLYNKVGTTSNKRSIDLFSLTAFWKLRHIVATYGAKTWTLTARPVNKLKVAQPASHARRFSKGHDPERNHSTENQSDPHGSKKCQAEVAVGWSTFVGELRTVGVDGFSNRDHVWENVVYLCRTSYLWLDGATTCLKQLAGTECTKLRNDPLMLMMMYAIS